VPELKFRPDEWERDPRDVDSEDPDTARGGDRGDAGDLPEDTTGGEPAAR